MLVSQRPSWFSV